MSRISEQWKFGLHVKRLFRLKSNDVRSGIEAARKDLEGAAGTDADADIEKMAEEEEATLARADSRKRKSNGIEVVDSETGPAPSKTAKRADSPIPPMRRASSPTPSTSSSVAESSPSRFRSIRKNPRTTESDTRGRSGELVDSHQLYQLAVPGHSENSIHEWVVGSKPGCSKKEPKNSRVPAEGSRGYSKCTLSDAGDVDFRYKNVYFMYDSEMKKSIAESLMLRAIGNGIVKPESLMFEDSTTAEEQLQKTREISRVIVDFSVNYVQTKLPGMIQDLLSKWLEYIEETCLEQERAHDQEQVMSDLEELKLKATAEALMD